jgi:ribosomal protein S27AE
MDIRKIRTDRLRADRRCPKCGGNLFLTSDIYGWYEQCLQCAHTTYLDVIYNEKKEPVLVKAPVQG